MVDCTGKLYFGPDLTTIFIVRMLRGSGEVRFAADTQLPLSMIRFIAGNLKKGVCVIREPGNPQFKETILEEKLHFGGETSGHFFFTPLEDRPRFRHVAVDDGLLASLHMVEFLYQSGQPFHDLARGIFSEVDDGRTVIWSKRFSLPEEQRMDVLDQVRERFRPHLPDLGKQIRFRCSETLKQFRDDLSEALTIRPSQTEPVLKVQWEGPAKRKAAAKNGLKRELAECYRKVKAPLPPELA
jgi:phosphomannomutase